MWKTFDTPPSICCSPCGFNVPVFWLRCFHQCVKCRALQEQLSGGLKKDSWGSVGHKDEPLVELRQLLIYFMTEPHFSVFYCECNYSGISTSFKNKLNQIRVFILFSAQLFKFPRRMPFKILRILIRVQLHLWNNPIPGFYTACIYVVLPIFFYQVIPIKSQTSTFGQPTYY